jgi:hypothetical protein
VLLDHAARNPRDVEMMTALAAGSIDAGDSSIRRLLERIVEFENVALQDRVSRLQRDAALLPTDSGSDDLLAILRRFSRDCADLLFFRRLGFLPAEQVESLDSAVCSQVGAVFGELARHVERESGASPGSDADEAAFLIDRLRLQWMRGGRIEQLR